MTLRDWGCGYGFVAAYVTEKLDFHYSYLSYCNIITWRVIYSIIYCECCVVMLTPHERLEEVQLILQACLAVHVNSIHRLINMKGGWVCGVDCIRYGVLLG